MPHVVIVGAGMTGAFAAYFLGKKGFATTLLDRSGIAREASGHNPGGLNPLHGPGIPGPMQPLALHALRCHLDNWEPVARLSGKTFAAHRVTRLELAFDEAETTELRQAQTLYEEADGFAARWLDPADLQREEPRVSPQAVAGLFLEGNGMVDSQPYAEAVAAAAVAQGTRWQQSAVTGLRTAESRVREVIAGDAAIPCDALILATGPWMDDAERWLGAALPVRPLKGQLLRASAPGGPFPHHVTWKTIGIYQLPGGVTWLGGTQEEAGYDTQPTPEGRAAILREVSRLVPCLAGAEIVGHEAALRPVTPDGLPILGPVPGWDNVFVASGAGTKGVLLGAGLGECLSRLVAGEEPACPLESFSPERFQHTASPSRPA